MTARCVLASNSSPTPTASPTRRVSSERSPTRSVTAGWRAASCWRCRVDSRPEGRGGGVWHRRFSRRRRTGARSSPATSAARLDAVIDGETGLWSIRAISSRSRTRSRGCCSTPTCARAARARRDASVRESLAWPLIAARVQALLLELLEASRADSARVAVRRVTPPRSAAASARCLACWRRCPRACSRIWPPARARCATRCRRSACPHGDHRHRRQPAAASAAHAAGARGDRARGAAGAPRGARAHGRTIVHANSIRAGIVLGLARRRDGAGAGGRSCTSATACPPGSSTSATMRLIGATAGTVVANSHYTARSVRAAAPGARVEVVYNAVDLARFDPARIDRAAARAAARGWRERAAVARRGRAAEPMEGPGHGDRGARRCCAPRASTRSCC